MNVLGIDPSLTATGIAVIGEDLPAVTDCIQTKSDDPIGARLDYLAMMVAECIGKYRPDTVVIERPFEIAQRPSAVKLGMALGAVLLGISQCYPRPSMPLLVAPKVRAKYATGKGAATKEAVLAAAIRRLGYKGHNHNEADALWLAHIAGEVAHSLAVFEGPQEGWPHLPDVHYTAIDDWNSWERVL